METTSIQFTDQELKILSDILRQHKLTVSTEEVILVAQGKIKSPLLEVVLKVAGQWEAREAELKKAEATPAPLEPEIVAQA